MTEAGFGQRLDALVADYVDADLPEPSGLPWYVAPLPVWLENVALRLAWVLVAVNLAGTAFGFWFYSPVLTETPLVMWPIVPVSPLATLYISLSFALWRLGYDGTLTQIVHVLAFIGCIKYGLWTAVVQGLINDPTLVPTWLWHFLIWSHVGMAVEAFLVQRYADFSLPAITAGTGWFLLNDNLDYFLTVFGGPHHTPVSVLPDDPLVGRTAPEFYQIAGTATTLTVVCVFLALVTRIAMLREG